MQADGRLEATVDKVVSETESSVLTGLDAELAEAERRLAASRESLEREYDRIVEDGRKEAGKIRRQAAGSADLEARNRRLVASEEAISGVLGAALEEVRAARGGTAAMRAMIREAADALGTTEITVSAGGRDRDVASSALSGFKGASLDPEPIDCAGGIRARTADGTMSFDNTVDARFERMRPMLRKAVAAELGLD